MCMCINYIYDHGFLVEWLTNRKLGSLFTNDKSPDSSHHLKAYPTEKEKELR